MTWEVFQASCMYQVLCTAPLYLKWDIDFGIYRYMYTLSHRFVLTVFCLFLTEHKSIYHYDNVSPYILKWNEVKSKNKTTLFWKRTETKTQQSMRPNRCTSFNKPKYQTPFAAVYLCCA